MNYGKGFVPDRVNHGLPDWEDSHLAKGSVVSSTVSVRQWSGKTPDQGPTGSCIGHGTKLGLVTVCAANGIELPFDPSPKGIYDVARITARAREHVKGQRLPDLADEGAMPADALFGMRNIGIRPMGPQPADGRYSDCDPDNVNEDPSLEDFTVQAGHLVVGPYRLSYTGATLVDALIVSIDKRGVPCTGIFVDSAFEEWDPKNGPLDGVPNFQDPNGGGHWIEVETIETLRSGLRIITLHNTWSDSWGEEGRIRVTERWYRASASNPTVLVPNLSFAEAA